MYYKEGVDHPKKKVHKKTISNIDDFLESGSPSQSSSKEPSNCDIKKSYDREKVEKLYKKEKLYEKQKLYERDKAYDKERLYEKDKSYSSKDHVAKSDISSEKNKHRKEGSISKYADSKTDSPMKYIDNMKKQKLLSSSSKLDRTKEKDDLEKPRKHSLSGMDMSGGMGERKRLHSDSGPEEVYKKSGKEKIKKHIKRTDDSDDDIGPQVKKSKERSDSYNRHSSEMAMEDSDVEDEDYSHTKHVRKHSSSYDLMESKEKYFVRDERDSKMFKESQLNKADNDREKDVSVKSKPHTAVQSSGFMKSMMKESIPCVDQKVDKPSSSKKLIDPRVKTDSSRPGDAKKLAQYSPGDYKQEKYRERKLSSGSDDHNKEVGLNIIGVN